MRSWKAEKLLGLVGEGRPLGRGDSPWEKFPCMGAGLAFHLHGNPDKPTTQLERAPGGGQSNPDFGNLGRGVAASPRILTCPWKSPDQVQASPALSTRASDAHLSRSPPQAPRSAAPPPPLPPLLRGQ